VTAPDYDTALRFYRDVLGLTESGSYTSPAGDRVTILDAGTATLELAEPGYAAYIDEVEVGRRVAGPVRVAFEVDDCRAVTDRLAAALRGGVSGYRVRVIGEDRATLQILVASETDERRPG